MTRQQLLKTYDSLSPAKRKQLEQFVTRLATTGKARLRKRPAQQEFGPDDEVFGMWRDREDLHDPSSWVRDLRHRQWGRRIGRPAD